MSITLPRDGQFWNEIKFEKMPARASTPIKLELTRLQRNWIRAEQKAGGKAGWTLCVKVRTNLWYYWCGTDPDVKSVEQGTHHFVRKSGELTNVGRMAAIIVRGDYGPSGSNTFETTDPDVTKIDKKPRRHRFDDDRSEEAKVGGLVRSGVARRTGKAA